MSINSTYTTTKCLRTLKLYNMYLLFLGLRKMTVLSSAETAEQPPRKKLCLSASRQLQSKSYALSQLNPMASPLDQPGN